MTSIVDRPPNTELTFPDLPQVDPDPDEFNQITQAFRRLGVELTADPKWPDTWHVACPLCMKENGGTLPENASAITYAWALPEYAGSMAVRCQIDDNDRHHLLDVTVALGVRTRLMRGILDGRGELQQILRAMDQRGLQYEDCPSTYADTCYKTQCPTCVKNGNLGKNLDLTIDDLLDPDNVTFGHVVAYCEGCGQGDAALAELGFITRLALRRSYGAVTWDTPEGEPEWLIDPIVEQGQFAEIYGPAGVGKSLFAQEQAFRLAEQGYRVLYLDHENAPREVKKRRLDMGFHSAPLDTLTYLSFPPISALDTPAGAARLHALVATARANIVFLDTWSKFIEGDEASPSTHTAVYNLTITPLRRQGVTVIALDHTGKDVARGPRGGSSKVDNVDVLWLLTGKGNGRLRLERRKTRTGRGPDIVELQRSESPLRHERSQPRVSDLLTPEVRACITKLDELDVPPGWGRERALRVLRANEYKVRAETLNTALRVRRERGNAPADTLDLTENETA